MNIKIKKKEVIWVIGSPRSGTTFITEYIGKHVDNCICEQWASYPHMKPELWKIPKGKTVFKYCTNSLHYEFLKNKYKNSKWVYVKRDPIHILYSVIFPKESSYPKRKKNEWHTSGKRWNKEKDEDLLKKFIEHYETITSAADKIKEAFIFEYENPDIKSLGSFLDLSLSEKEFQYNNRNLEYDALKMGKLVEILNKNYPHIIKER